MEKKAATPSKDRRFFITQRPAYICQVVEDDYAFEGITRA